MPTNTLVPHPYFNSRMAILLWVLVFGVFLVFTDVWRLPAQQSVLSWDVFGYYAYLPSALLHHDLLQLVELRQLYETYNPSSYFYAAHLTDSGNYSMSYTMGLAILYLPFFLLGHLGAFITDAPADGLSWPYQLAIYFGSGVYALIGLMVMRKVLSRFFEDRVVFLAILVLILATNYFFYSYIEIPMTHSYLFTLYALMLWLTIKWHETFKWKYAVLMGFVIGFIILIRPTEIVALLIPVLWGVTNKETLVQKAKTIWQYKGQLVVLALCTFLVGLPQLLYWKYTTGHFLYYSYGGLGFDFAHPHLMDGIFSWRKGWLIYTPAMVLAIIGFLPLYFTKRFMFWGMFLYALINVYIVFSWSVWYYGGGFGARAMVQSYAVMLFPLCAFFAYVLRQRVLLWGMAPLLVFFTALNLLQIWQYRQQMYSTEGMTKYVYRLLFFKTVVTKADIMALEHQEHLPGQSGLLAQPLSSIRFQDGIDTLALPGQSEEYIALDTALPLNEDSWIQVKINAKFDQMEYGYGNFGKAQIKFLDADGKILKKAQVKIQNLIGLPEDGKTTSYFGEPNTWDDIVFESQAPPGTQRVVVLLRNPGYGSTVFVRSIEVRKLSKR